MAITTGGGSGSATLSTAGAQTLFTTPATANAFFVIEYNWASGVATDLVGASGAIAMVATNTIGVGGGRIVAGPNVAVTLTKLGSGNVIVSYTYLSILLP